MTIGQKIKIFRKKFDLTQAELAEKIGVSSNLVSKWEQEERNPKEDDIEKLAKFFNQPVEFFFPEKSQLISLRIFAAINNNNITFQYNDWEKKYLYEKVAANIVNNEIFEDDVTKLTQEEIDNRYFLFKENLNVYHVIRFDFKRIVDKRYFALEEDGKIVIRQLFSSSNGQFYSIHVDDLMLSNLINEVKAEKLSNIEKEDIIKMKTYSDNDKNKIIGIVIASLRTIQ